MLEALPVMSIVSQTRAEKHVNVAPDSYYTQFEIYAQARVKVGNYVNGDVSS